MKTKLLIRVGHCVLMLCLSVANLSAQEAEAPEEPENSLQAGQWALQFQIDDNFTLSSFQGAVLSIKRHWSPASALRLGLGGGATSDDLTSVSALVEVDSILSVRDGTRDSSSKSIRIDVQHLQYFQAESRVTLFLGIGVLGRYSISSEERETSRSTASGTVPETVSKAERTDWAVGFSGTLGVEWFATKQISFTAEYGLVAEYTYVGLEGTRFVFSSSRTSYDLDERDGFRLAPRPVLLGLSVYF